MQLSVPTSILARAAAVAALTLAAASARAQVTAGSQLNFSGTADVVDVGAAGLVLTFNPATVTTGDGNTGDFAGFNGALAGITGAIKTLTVGAGPQDVPAFVTVGGYTFNLRALPSGTLGQDDCYVAPAAGQRCSPIQTPGTAISPINLLNHAPDGPDGPLSSSAYFHLTGTVTGPGGGVAHEFFGTIMTDFPGYSFQEALAGVEAYGFEALPYRATFVTGAEVTVSPEPSTVALAAAGLAGLGAAARRRGARARRA